MSKHINPEPATERDADEGAVPPYASPNAFDLEALRLPPNYGATLGVKKVLTAVPIAKPKAAQFFRVHRDPAWTFPVFIVELKEEREIYVVTPQVAPVLGNLVKPVLLHAAIDRGDAPFLIPVILPGEDGRRNSWHESRAQAIERAKERWVRITANISAGAYDVFEALGALPDPAWPACTPSELFQVAMRGRTISDETHPVVKQLMGQV